MSKPALFCLLAAASRAARRAKRFERRLRALQHERTTTAQNQLLGTLMRFSFRAEVAKYAYFDAAYEQQQGNLSRIQR